MSRHARLAAIERARTRRLAAEAGAEYGFSADEILDEAARFFTLPLQEQLATLHIGPDEVVEYAALKARILRCCRRQQPLQARQGTPTHVPQLRITAHPPRAS